MIIVEKVFLFYKKNSESNFSFVRWFAFTPRKVPIKFSPSSFCEPANSMLITNFKKRLQSSLATELLAAFAEFSKYFVKVAETSLIFWEERTTANAKLHDGVALRDSTFHLQWRSWCLSPLANEISIFINNTALFAYRLNNYCRRSHYKMRNCNRNN